MNSVRLDVDLATSATCLTARTSLNRTRVERLAYLGIRDLAQSDESKTAWRALIATPEDLDTAIPLVERSNVSSSENCGMSGQGRGEPESNPGTRTRNVRRPYYGEGDQPCIIDLFVWREDGYRDYRYIRCRIQQSKEHPQLVGADLLLSASRSPSITEVTEPAVKGRLESHRFTGALGRSWLGSVLISNRCFDSTSALHNTILRGVRCWPHLRAVFRPPAH